MHPMLVFAKLYMFETFRQSLAMKAMQIPIFRLLMAKGVAI